MTMTDKVILDTGIATTGIVLAQYGELVLMGGGIILVGLRIVIALKELKK